MYRTWTKRVLCVTVPLIGAVSGCRHGSEGPALEANNTQPAGDVSREPATDGIRFTRTDLQANTFSGSSQDTVSVAQDDQGRTIVVWHSRRQEFGNYGIYAQRLDETGRRVGPETRINAYAPSAQTQPAVVVGPTGAVWFAWRSFGQDGDRGGVIARRFDDALNPRTAEVPVNTVGRGNQGEITLAATPDGGAIVAWTSDGPGGGRCVFARRIAADGVPLGDPFRLSGASSGSDRVPSLGTSPDGAVVAAWSHDGRIVGRRLDATTGVAGLEFAISDTDAARHIEPAVAVADSGAFCVVFATLIGDRYAISVRRFDATGRPTSGVERVDQGGFGQTTGLAVAARGDGRYVVSWSSYDNSEGGTDLYGRAFDADGRPASRVFRVTAASKGNQQIAPASGAPRVNYADDGRIAVAWSGNAGFGDKSAANVTLLTPDGMEAPRTPSRTFASTPHETTGAAPHAPPVFTPRAGQVDRSAVMETEGGGPGFLGIVDTGWNPPDAHIAVGPEHIVAMTNGAIMFFDKDGTVTFEDEIENPTGFWGSLGATFLVFDPEVIYDQYSGRFMAMANERASNQQPYFLLAVSDDSDPNGTWHKYRLDVRQAACGAGPCNGLIDSPNIAVDANTVYLSADFFGPSRYFIYMLEKTPLLSGAVPNANGIVMPGSLSLGLAMNTGDPPAQYFVESILSGTPTTIRIHAVTDPLGTPQTHLTTLTVPLYRQPENAPSGGTTTRVSTFDSRFWSCMYRNGSLWATHHVGSQRVLQRWYQIRLNGWPQSGSPELVQWGEVDPGGTVRTYFGSIWADASDNVAMVFSQSSPTEFISLARAGRLASDPLGEMRPAETLKESTSSLTVTGSARWGDYSDVVTDPSIEGLFWGHGEYVATEWRTWISSFSIADVTPPAIVSSDPFDGYIDPRQESSDGVTLDEGIDHVTITFDDAVLAAGGLPLDASSFAVSVTGGAGPGIASIDASANPTIEVVLDSVLPVQEYTTISADVEDAAGNTAVVSVTYGFLPADSDQDGVVGPFDLLRFRQIVNGLFVPEQGTVELFVDIDRSGDVAPFDLLAFRQLINGLGNATRPWAGASLP